MDLSTQQQQHHHHHLQEMVGGSEQQTLESMLECRKEHPHQQQQQQQDEKKAAIRPPGGEESLKCPRCDSTNTKFCYYNNYSLTQPRYFCKSCRRYWTKGGTLRNVPVGGGCRKNNSKRSSSNNSSSANSLVSKRGGSSQDHSLMSSPNPYHNNNNNNSHPLSSLITGLSSYDHSDQISLAIARLQQNQNNHHHFGGSFEHGGGYNSIFGNNDDHVDAIRGGYFESPSLINGFHHHLNQNHLFGSSSAGHGNMQQQGHNENGGGSSGGFLRNLGLINASDEDLGINVTSSLMSAATVDVAAAGGYGDQEIGGNCGILSTSVKQEGDQNRSVLMAGFPWQFGGGGGGGAGADQTGNNMVDFEPPVKPMWNGFGSSSWHGLLNSPLM